MANGNPATAHRAGIPMQQALRINRPAVKVMLFAELKRLWRAVRLSPDKTWQTDEDLQDAVDDILEVCPTLRLEEILMCFRQIRRGERTLYGRLDTPTLLDALRDYDVNTATAEREAANNHQLEVSPILAEAYKEIAKTMPIRVLTYKEAKERGSVLTPEEREAMKARDQERSNA